MQTTPMTDVLLVIEKNAAFKQRSQPKKIAGLEDQKEEDATCLVAPCWLFVSYSCFFLCLFGCVFFCFVCLLDCFFVCLLVGLFCLFVWLLACLFVCLVVCLVLLCCLVFCYSM